MDKNWFEDRPENVPPEVHAALVLLGWEPCEGHYRLPGNHPTATLYTPDEREPLWELGPIAFDALGDADRLSMDPIELALRGVEYVRAHS